MVPSALLVLQVHKVRKAFKALLVRTAPKASKATSDSLELKVPTALRVPWAQTGRKAISDFRAWTVLAEPKVPWDPKGSRVRPDKTGHKAPREPTELKEHKASRGNRASRTWCWPPIGAPTSQR